MRLASDEVHQMLSDSGDETAAGLFAIAAALNDVAHAIHRLGNADASTPMGGLEALGVANLDGAKIIAEALRQGN